MHRQLQFEIDERSYAMNIKPILMSSLLALSLAGCYGEGREPGDDPNRADEGPDGGRPETDPRQTVEPKGYGGGATREPTEAESGRGSLDGASDDVLAPDSQTTPAPDRQ